VDVSGCHASLVRFGALGKPGLCLLRRNRIAPATRVLTQLQTDILAHEMALSWKQVLFPDLKDLGEKFDLFAVGWASQRFYIGQDIASHVDISKELQLSNQFVLRPASLVAQPCHVSPYNICVSGH
jgi:hypothetical protein